MNKENLGRTCFMCPIFWKGKYLYKCFLAKDSYQLDNSNSIFDWKLCYSLLLMKASSKRWFNLRARNNAQNTGLKFDWN